MKHFNLSHTIPVTAAGVLLAVGCGGKATEGDTTRTQGPETLEPPAPPTGDPLSDENFNSSLEHHFAFVCDEVIACRQEDLWDGQCQEYFVSNMHRIYDTDSPYCRELILDATTCGRDYLACEPQDSPCTELYLGLLDDCVDLYDADPEYDPADY